ncbi:hypothetical protein CC78DRAFT_576609 [Lojkania enalia]|uniref:Uncharacterized protein n=1 Tax=Lojkania enalia TaxID=147567 RepID=A0A9P4KG08_9PLEO|nr:hypothetical protein CC78DRAFT_576609 [Didymosphaeria enalia]
MPLGQLRPIGHERELRRQRPPLTRHLKDKRRGDCGLHVPAPNGPNAPHGPCSPKHEFAPSGNRFSILAELDQRPKQTKWAFDITQSHANSPRRRGKRGGKTNRLKFERQHHLDSPKDDDEGIEDLCRRLSALHLNDKNSTPLSDPSESAPVVEHRDNSKNLTEDVRHHWMPQFRPNSLAEPTVSTALEKSINERRVPSPLRKHLLTTEKDPPPQDMTEFRCKESRFFPHSSFFTAPEMAAHQSRALASSTAKVVKASSAKRSIAFTAPTGAQRSATTAACCASTTLKTTSPLPITSSSVHKSRPASPSPLSLVSSPPGSPTQTPNRVSDPLSLATPSFAQFPVTSSLTTSPTLAISPTISAVPSLIPSPSILSARSSPFGLSHIQPPLPPRPQATTAGPYTSPLETWSPLSWQDISNPASPLSLLPSPIAPVPMPALPPRKANPVIAPSTCFARSLPPAIPEFAKQRPSSPFSSVVQKDLDSFLKMGHANPCWCDSHAPQRKPISLASNNHLTILRKRKNSESDLESVCLTPTVSSDFEDLALDHDDDDDDDEWQVVSPSERDGKLESVHPPSSIPAKIEESIPPATEILYPELQSVLPQIPPPPDGVHDKTAVAQDLPPQPLISPCSETGEAPLKPWATTPHSKDANTKAVGSASAVEWPTLQEAMGIELNMRRQRQRRSRSRGSACSSMDVWGIGMGL